MNKKIRNILFTVVGVLAFTIVVPNKRKGLLDETFDKAAIHGFLSPVVGSRLLWISYAGTGHQR
jgi:hypothetical protein